MVSIDYAAKAARAQAMLQRYGAPVRLQRVEESDDYDPRGGAAGTQVTRDGVGLLLGYKQDEIDGTRIRQGDQQVYLGAVGMMLPKSGDVIAFLDAAGAETSKHPVVAVGVLAPAGVPVLYTLQVRGTAGGAP